MFYILQPTAAYLLRTPAVASALRRGKIIFPDSLPIEGEVLLAHLVAAYAINRPRHFDAAIDRGPDSRLHTIDFKIVPNDFFPKEGFGKIGLFRNTRICTPVPDFKPVFNSKMQHSIEFRQLPFLHPRLLDRAGPTLLAPEWIKDLERCICDRRFGCGSPFTIGDVE